MAWPEIHLSSNLRQRILSAVILAPMVLGIIIQGGAWFVALILLSAIIMAFEWHDMTVTHASEIDQRYAKRWQCAGILYIFLPCLSLMMLRTMPQGLGVILWLLAVVWATDIAAYFTGRAIGGPKLAPRISPNKTWAGLCGGMIAAALAGLIAGVIADVPHKPIFALLSGGLAVVAQAGDLLESGLKRHFGIKDSGTIIPGHGGVLDRVDGILTVAPLVAVVVMLRGGVLF